MIKVHIAFIQKVDAAFEKSEDLTFFGQLYSFGRDESVFRFACLLSCLCCTGEGIPLAHLQ